jgi:hypothetical protein
MGGRANLQRKWAPAPNPQRLKPGAAPGKLSFTNMRTNKRGRGKHPLEELRKQIGKMWDAGATQREIADELQVPSSDVRYHLLKAGVPAALQHKAHPVVRGKRACVQCGESKELSLYPSPRHTVCLTCLSKKRTDRRS